MLGMTRREKKKMDENVRMSGGGVILYGVESGVEPKEKSLVKLDEPKGRTFGSTSTWWWGRMGK